MSLICSDSALRALLRVLICTQIQAYKGAVSGPLGDALDVAEYLVAILQNHEGLTEQEGLAQFRLFLEDLETRFTGYTGLLTAFDTDRQEGAPRSLSGNGSAVAVEVR